MLKLCSDTEFMCTYFAGSMVSFTSQVACTHDSRFSSMVVWFNGCSSRTPRSLRSSGFNLAVCSGGAVAVLSTGLLHLAHRCRLGRPFLTSPTWDGGEWWPSSWCWRVSASPLLSSRWSLIPWPTSLVYSVLRPSSWWSTILGLSSVVVWLLLASVYYSVIVFDGQLTKSLPYCLVRKFD